MNPGRAGHDPSKVALVREAWAGILTMREIAEAAEVSTRTVWRWTRDLPPRPRGRRPE